MVLLVGRPNVGKSSLYNRIAGQREAIVTHEPGTTRDILCREVRWNGRTFRLCDSGGLLAPGSDPLQEEVEGKVHGLLEVARLILFLVDGRDGLTPVDEEVARRLRPHHEKVILVVNKVDHPSHRAGTFEFYRLGLGDPWPVSAAHGQGVADLLDEVAARLQVPTEESRTPGPEPLRLTLLGRPNVGKSSLANALLGENRQVVSSLPGTTRDAVTWPLELEGRPFVLVDTAGLRRPGRVERGIEFFSVRRAEEALRLSHLALLVLDGAEGVVALDQRIGGLIQKAKKGAVLVVNKSDRLPGKEAEERLREVKEAFSFLPFAPVVQVSA
ncbi:MAG: ribosome biogenesis GTPase Der, partial [Bacillota bacterium]|nr:ribosome biogenesis GTPase Der [Bacillota bacterium]